MTTTAGTSNDSVAAPPGGPLRPAEGVELLGAMRGSGYRRGAALVRRGDGQVVHLGSLMYAVLEAADGRRSMKELAEAASSHLGRRLLPEHVEVLAGKLAAQGLLAGSEHRAPPKANPLLALRWKVLVTDPVVTRRLTAPFKLLFARPVMWPVIVAFGAVFWFVLVHKGLASGTAQAFKDPALLLLIFLVAAVSAGFHELGHAAACTYGGATPGGMGMGLYLVWPAFYTDVTDAYRLDRRARLRVDLAGLYFNALLAVATMVAWLFVRVDVLLLVVAVQILQMVRQLSPIIRADGYHILSDATGVPDLYAHLGPTVRRLIPGRKEPSALTGGARALVTVWVLVIVPVLVSLMLSAILFLPRLAATAWHSGRHLADQIPAQVSRGDVVAAAASVLQLVALLIPVGASVLVLSRFARTLVTKAKKWSDGRPGRRFAAVVAGVGLLTLMGWAWWPSGQYRMIRPSDKATLGTLLHDVVSPARVARSRPVPVAATLTAGRYLALSMVPVGGATAAHPAVFFVRDGAHPFAIVTSSRTVLGPGGQRTVILSGDTRYATAPADASAFPYRLPSAPGPQGTQAMALNTTDHGVSYDVAYALVTVSGGAPVTETNSAFALADCKACTTVAVSVQLVLVVGQSNVVAPIDVAVARNDRCPACATTAIADQLVVTLKSAPSAAVTQRLFDTLRQLNALATLGVQGNPKAVAAYVAAVQQSLEQQLSASGLVEPASNTTTSTSTPTTSSTTTSTSTSTTSTTYSSTGGSGYQQPGYVTPTTTTGSTSTTYAGSTTSSTSSSTTSTTTTTTAPA